MSRRLGQELSFLELKGYSDDDVLTLAFGAIAAGADKTGTMNVDEFAYMNNWLLRWEIPDIPKLGPDEKDRFYYDYSGFSYNRLATYGNKYVRIALLFPDGTWHYEYQSLYSAVSWTSPNLLIDYAFSANTGITGFSNAADDAIQVLEFIHESDLIEYSPYFTQGGFVNPN
jgi:hypothetical protein